MSNIERFGLDYQSKLPECPICYEKIYPANSVTLECGHKMHKECLARWAGNPKNEQDKDKRCPICRGPLEVKRTSEMIRRDDNKGGKRGKKSRKVRKSRRVRKSRKVRK